MFRECTLHWWMRYVCEIRKPKSIQIAVGSAVHEVLARNFRQKAVTRVDLPIDELLDEYATLFDLMLAEGAQTPANKTSTSYRDAGLATLQEYLTTMAPSMYPRLITVRGTSEPAVEMELRVRILQTDYDMLGYVDLWLEDGRAVDYKVCASKWSARDLEKHKRQVLAYCMMLGSIVPFTFHICVRDEIRPRVQELPCTDISDQDIESHLDDVRVALVEMEALRRGDVKPIPKSGYCNEQLCSHYWECRDWKYGIFDLTRYATDRHGVDTLEEAA